MRENYNRYFLSGGIFLDLLIHASRCTDGNRNRDKKGALTNPDVLRALICVVYPDYKGELLNVSSVSKYKTCPCAQCAGSHLDDADYKTEFINKMNDAPKSLLKRTNEFIEKCLIKESSEKMSRLGGALLQLLDDDNEILAEAGVYMKENFSLATKEELFTYEKVYLPNLILGVFYFIVTNRQDKNTNGRKTYDKLHEVSVENRGPRPLKENIGDTYKSRVVVEFPCLLNDEEFPVDHQQSPEAKQENASPKQAIYQNNIVGNNIIGGVIQIQNGNSTNQIQYVSNLTIHND